MALPDTTIKNLKEKSKNIRKSILTMLLESGSGHTAGPLGMTDIFAYLYFQELNHNPKKPDWTERDRIILSNGHICPVLYATMAHSGYFPVSELKTLRKLDSRLQGHPHREFLPAVETSSGPLGSGLSQAIGMAIADRYMTKNQSKKYFYCFLGDGELNEGQNWEAIMLAPRENLHNIIAIIDRNNIQIDGFTEDVMPLGDLEMKWKSFGWNVIQMDGHNFNSIDDAFKKAKQEKIKPTVLIGMTIPGKGVKEFENKYEWHGKTPNKTQVEEGFKELDTI